MKSRRQSGFLIGRVQQASGRVFARILRRHDIRLTPPQGRVLFSLWREGAMPIADIAARTGMSKSTLTGLLDRLERDGHIRRVRSTADRRVLLIKPTAGDARSQAVFVKASEEMTKLFFDGFTDSEIDRIEADLVRILANLRRAETPPTCRRASDAVNEYFSEKE